MIDYNQPWGWGLEEDSRKKRQGQNTIAPLGGGGEGDVAPSVQVVPPSEQERILAQGKQKMATTAIDKGVDGVVDYYKGPKASAMSTAPLGSQVDAGVAGAAPGVTPTVNTAMTGASEYAAEMANAAIDTGAAAEMAGEAVALGEGAVLAGEAAQTGLQVAGDAASAAGGAASMAGPLGAAVGGIMKGEYDEAAGATAGAMVGSMFGPLGTFVGSKLGGMAGNAVGSMFGFQDGTTGVDDDKNKLFEITQLTPKELINKTSFGLADKEWFQKLDPITAKLLDSKYMSGPALYDPANFGGLMGFQEGTAAVPQGGKAGGATQVAPMAASGMATHQMDQRTPAQGGGKGGAQNPAQVNPWGDTGGFQYYGEQRANVGYDPGQTGFAKISPTESVRVPATTNPTGGKAGTGPVAANPAPTPTAPPLPPTRDYGTRPGGIQGKMWDMAVDVMQRNEN